MKNKVSHFFRNEGSPNVSKGLYEPDLPIPSDLFDGLLNGDIAKLLELPFSS